jgi:broad specificity phosphatase PhoE
MRALIVRHGNTFMPGEAPRRIGARTDLPLVDSGRAQARALAAHFAHIRFDHCLASPLARTRETAAIVAPYLVANATEWLREIDHGPDEGKSDHEVLARIGPQALAAWDSEAVAPPGWIVDADERIAAWQAFFATLRGTVLLITSNGAARFARLALDLRPAKLRTGAYGEVVDRHVTNWDVRPFPS